MARAHHPRQMPRAGAELLPLAAGWAQPFATRAAPLRLAQTGVFKVSANTWYTLKTRVDANADGSGVVRGKVWPKGQPEPEAWTVEAKVARAHTQGSPGIFGFTPMNQKRVYLDNLSITENK